MARKQTRRTISLNRHDYEAVKREAAQRGVTLVALVEMGLAAIGVPLAPHPRQSLELVQTNQRARSVAQRKRETPRPSRERQVLGDHVADAHGFV